MTVVARFVRDRRRATTWWVIGTVAMVLFTVALFPTIEGETAFEESIENLPDGLRSVFGLAEGISIITAPGYLNTRLFSSFVPLILLIFGIGLGARAIGGDEEEGRLELLLANPVTRLRVALERGGAALAMVAGLTAVTALSLLALGPLFGALDHVGLWRLAAAFWAVLGLALLHTALAFAIGAVVGRRGPALAGATALAVGGYLFEGLAASSDAIGRVAALNPWHWYLDANIVVRGANAAALVLPLVLAAGLLTGGTWAFLRRDLR